MVPTCDEADLAVVPNFKRRAGSPLAAFGLQQLFSIVDLQTIRISNPTRH